MKHFLTQLLFATVFAITCHAADRPDVFCIRTANLEESAGIEVPFSELGGTRSSDRVRNSNKTQS